jgi:hypothetical protein
LPRIEAPDVGGNCDRVTGANCTLIPTTDDGQPVNFYPFYSIAQNSGIFGGKGGQQEGSDRQDNKTCAWLIGNDVPGLTSNDFGKNNQYGSLLFLQYLVFGGGGSLRTITDDFRQVMNNPCRLNI